MYSTVGVHKLCPKILALIILIRKYNKMIHHWENIPSAMNNLNTHKQF